MYMLEDDSHLWTDTTWIDRAAYEAITDSWDIDETIRAFFEAYDDAEPELQRRIKEMLPVLSKVVDMTPSEYKRLVSLFMDYGEYDRNLYALALIARSIDIAHDETDVYYEWAKDSGNL